ncbi:MAG TPA: hypothetical protein VN622_09085 [Clostridia bacterium]|nr:hypothetical protein [Clostridia bacterium]
MTKHLYRRAVAPLLIVLCMAAALSTVACDDADKHRAAQAAAGVASGLSALEAEAEALYHAGAIDKQEAIVLVLGISDLTRVNDQYVEQLRSFSTLDTSNRQVVVNWLAEMTRSVDALNNEGVLRVKNPASRAKLAAYIAAVRSSLGIVSTLTGAK